MWRKVQAIKPREREGQRKRKTVDQVRSQRTFPAAINRQQKQQKQHKLDRFCDNVVDDDDNDNKNRGQARATSLSPSPSPVGYNSFSVITRRPSTPGELRHLQHGARWVIVAHMQGRMANKEILEV